MKHFNFLIDNKLVEIRAEDIEQAEQLAVLIVKELEE